MLAWLLIASLWGGWGGGWGGGWSQSDSLGVVITGLGTYTSAVVKDSMMYVAQVGAYGPGDGLMKIYNISDPSTPVLRNSISCIGFKCFRDYWGNYGKSEHNSKQFWRSELLCW